MKAHIPSDSMCMCRPDTYDKKGTSPRWYSYPKNNLSLTMRKNKLRGHFCRKFCEYLKMVMKNKERIKYHILGEPCKPNAV